MPDSPIHDLTSASNVTSGDLFVLEQDGQAKKLEGQYLLNYVYERLDVAHGATSILPITTEPTAYTIPTHGFTPAYRIELAYVTSEARVNSVLVGDQLRYDAYIYPVGYVDTVYAFLGPRVSIKGDPGSDAEVTEANIEAALGYIPASEDNIPDLSPYRTASAQDAIDDLKQDVISDLSDIRRGASAGDTALQPSAIVSSVSAASTNAQVPGAKLFFDTALLNLPGLVNAKTEAVQDMLTYRYSSGTTYAAGSLVIHNDQLWRCLVATSDAPSEGANWTATTVAAENALNYQDVTATTGSSAFEDFYYVDVGVVSDANKARVLSIMPLSVNNNVPTIIHFVTGNQLRVYTHRKDISVTFRIWYRGTGNVL